MQQTRLLAMKTARSAGDAAPRAICSPQRSDGIAQALNAVYGGAQLPVPDEWTALLGRIEAVQRARGHVTPRR